MAVASVSKALWHLNMLDKELDILNKIIDRYTP
jgi:hypothetical protein